MAKDRQVVPGGAAETGSPELLVIGEVNVDLIMEGINQLPELGKERIVDGMTLTMGSSSAILAANAAALGVSVGFVGRMGNDTFGAYMRERLDERGVDTSRMIVTPDHGTGLTVIYTSDGRRGMITYPGVMEYLTLDDVPWDYVSRGRHLHVSSYYLQSGLRPGCAELFSKAREKGLSTSLDTNWDPEEKWGEDVLDVLDHVDVFLPNDDEARLISGSDDLSRALEILSARAGTVVITCGDAGAIARRGDETFTIPAVEVTPVDAVGAGDTFNAGFLSRFIRGEPLQQCLEFGMLAGAFSTQAVGGTAAFDAPARLEAFVKANTSSVRCVISAASAL
jgi:sugar/nucleoside kinase (ribokinase family)